MKQQPQRPRRSLIPLILLILVFIIPIAIAWLLYTNANLYKPNLTNKGDLILPPFSISELALTNELEQPIDNRTGKTFTAPSATRTSGAWMVLLLLPQTCDTTCLKGLYLMQQIRLAMGADQDRVERAVLTYKNSNNSYLLNSQLKPFKGTRLLITEPKGFRDVILAHVKKPYALHEGTFFIVDPLGNFMMSYPPRVNPMDIFKDLKHLLKASQIG